MSKEEILRAIEAITKVTEIAVQDNNATLYDICVIKLKILIEML